MDTDPLTSEGERLVRNWKHCLTNLNQAERYLTSARETLSEAEKALCEWILPTDVSLGEKISVWHGRELIQVEVTEEGRRHGKVTIRRKAAVDNG